MRIKKHTLLTSVDNGYLVKIEHNVKLTDIFEAPVQCLNKNWKPVHVK